ncbi:hypothetical protein M067_3550 [Bacteroides fragilis str. J-143-4]|nr:hypothetical protein M067_3550 [Bacteroides fragilis str. J-143-4]
MRTPGGKLRRRTEGRRPDPVGKAGSFIPMKQDVSCWYYK